MGKSLRRPRPKPPQEVERNPRRSGRREKSATSSPTPACSIRLPTTRSSRKSPTTRSSQKCIPNLVRPPQRVVHYKLRGITALFEIPLEHGVLILDDDFCPRELTQPRVGC